MGNALLRWALVVVMGIATFFPNWGVGALSIAWFQAAPIPVTIFDLVWIIVLSVLLPLTLQAFKMVSTAAVVLILAASIYMMFTHAPWAFNVWPAYMWGVVVVFFGFGWLLISTPLWRWVKGTMPVAQTEHNNNDQPSHHV